MVVFKVPAFTGIEKWEVWYHRFEAVAELKGWDETDKLQELLPRLQGDAGDFSFDELAARTLKSYHKLTKELKSKFGIIEHARTYRLQFPTFKLSYGLETVIPNFPFLYSSESWQSYRVIIFSFASKYSTGVYTVAV
jgi:hypothetical protein